ATSTTRAPAGGLSVRLRVGSGPGAGATRPEETVDGPAPVGDVPAPAAPREIPDTGLELEFLLNLMLKAMYVVGADRQSRLVDHLKLVPAVVFDLMEEARTRSLIQSLGAAASGEVRYEPTARGRERASEALAQSPYIGPAPVPLAAYQEQVRRQGIRRENVDQKILQERLSHLVLSGDIEHQLGPAINTGSAILLYGESGNGKTSIATAVARMFRDRIYIPYCLEVDGQIINIFDPTLHRARPAGDGASERGVDQRWVACERPVILSGGELTLEMLDLNRDPVARVAEAPLQLKAANGIFILDDFGRQIVQPQVMLNRWLLPLEYGVDYLSLRTGKKFPVPFDVLVIFSTNLPPHQLMDDAMMRRVPYKLAIRPPSPQEYAEIFDRVCAQHDLTLPDDVIPALLDDFYVRNGIRLARYQPKFLVEHVLAICQYEEMPPRIDRELAVQAARHLAVQG
ncbi:MAG TPA: hypothetical protein VFZ01_17015, partial [Geminicoccaceae bacterium]